MSTGIFPTAAQMVNASPMETLLWKLSEALRIKEKLDKKEEIFKNNGNCWKRPTQASLELLELVFHKKKIPTEMEIMALAVEVKMDPVKVREWFAARLTARNMAKMELDLERQALALTFQLLFKEFQQLSVDFFRRLATGNQFIDIVKMRAAVIALQTRFTVPQWIAEHVGLPPREPQGLADEVAMEITALQQRPVPTPSSSSSKNHQP